MNAHFPWHARGAGAHSIALNRIHQGDVNAGVGETHDLPELFRSANIQKMKGKLKIPMNEFSDMTELSPSSAKLIQTQVKWVAHKRKVPPFFIRDAGDPKINVQ